MKVYWASSAEQDRADIVEYIAQDNPSAAIQMDELFGKHPSLRRKPHDWTDGTVFRYP
jgi:plasmid stabilization system protein ParE